MNLLNFDPTSVGFWWMVGFIIGLAAIGACQSFGRLLEVLHKKNRSTSRLKLKER